MAQVSPTTSQLLDSKPPLHSRMENPGDGGAKRMARFTRGTRLQELTLLTRGTLHNDTKARVYDAIPPARLPLSVNPPTAIPSRPPSIQYENPWDTYKSIRVVERGGVVTVARTH